MTYSGLAWVHQSLFFYFYFSAAFNTIDHEDKPSEGSVLPPYRGNSSWDHGKGDHSIHISLPFRVIWGSNVFLFFFNTYLKLLGEVICQYEVQNHHRDSAIVTSNPHWANIQSYDSPEQGDLSLCSCGYCSVPTFTASHSHVIIICNLHCWLMTNEVKGKDIRELYMTSSVFNSLYDHNQYGCNCSHK